MRLPASLPVRFVFPHAPVRPVTLNNGFRMRAWYDLAAGDITSRADIAGVRESQAHIEALIAREKARGIEARRIVIAGFSQGGVMALYTASACRATRGNRSALDVCRRSREARG
jgi:phospholipase/carboxylesterase